MMRLSVERGQREVYRCTEVTQMVAGAEREHS